MHVLAKHYTVKMENGEKWSIPVNVIAMNRATYYFENDTDGEFKTIDDALNDTAELFACDDYEVEDWAKNNMNWSEVDGIATLLDSPSFDYQSGWSNGDAEIV